MPYSLCLIPPLLRLLLITASLSLLMLLSGTAAIGACYMYDKDSSNCTLEKYPVTAVYVCVASNRIPLG